MKKYFSLFICSLMGLMACKKESNPENNTPTNARLSKFEIVDEGKAYSFDYASDLLTEIAFSESGVVYYTWKFIYDSQGALQQVEQKINQSPASIYQFGYSGNKIFIYQTVGSNIGDSIIVALDVSGNIIEKKWTSFQTGNSQISDKWEFQYLADNVSNSTSTYFINGTPSNTSTATWTNENSTNPFIFSPAVESFVLFNVFGEYSVFLLSENNNAEIYFDDGYYFEMEYTKNADNYPTSAVMKVGDSVDVNFSTYNFIY